MSNPLDVDARLAEGRSAVDDLEEYVAACCRLGYRHRDLTMVPGQVADWYGGEEGMDLRALDADHAALSAAAEAAEDAARTQADLMARLGAAWSGRGAAEAGEFVWRSGEAAHDVSRAVRSAADAMAALRDALWRAVDAKVVATEGVDARQQVQRAEWLTAARTVTTGVGDVAAASELVDQRVKPFVDVDVGSGWVAAMRSASASIGAAYDAAVTTAAAPAAVFGVPGDLGPRAAPADRSSALERDSRPAPEQSRLAARGAAVVAAEPTAPPPIAPWPAVTSPSSAPAPVTPAPAAAPAPLADPASLPGSSSGALPSPGGLGTGAAGLGSGLAGFGQQLADLIGGLVGSSDDSIDAGTDGTDFGSADDAGRNEDDGMGDAEGAGDDDTEDAGHTGDDDTEDDGDDDAGDAEDDAATSQAAEESEPDPATQPEPEAAVPTPVPEPAPTPVVPVPGAVAQPDVGAVALPGDGAPTPCEIAADQLPQVGE